jgi:hypothetical protein
VTHLRFAWWAGDDRELAVWCRGPKIFPASLCRSVHFNIPISLLRTFFSTTTAGISSYTSAGSFRSCKSPRAARVCSCCTEYLHAKHVPVVASSQAIAKSAKQLAATYLDASKFEFCSKHHLTSPVTTYNMSDIAQEEEHPQQRAQDQDGDEQVPNDEVRQVNMQEAGLFSSAPLTFCGLAGR